MNIHYSIRFFSDWHCGSGLSDGFGADMLVIPDDQDLPFIPGKTLKGLLRHAAQDLAELQGNTTEWQSFIDTVFGVEGKEGTGTVHPSVCHFSNAELPEDIRTYLRQYPEKKQFLFKKKASTAILDTGIAKDHSLRVMETVVPMVLHAEIACFPDLAADRAKMNDCMKWVKRLGVSRNRGLGRCKFIWEGGDT